MDYREIAEKINESFESNLFGLGMAYQSHWSLRKWRITQDEKYILPVFYTFQSFTISTILKLESSLTDTEIGAKMLKSYFPKNPKQKARLVFYKKNPEVVYYISLIAYLFIAKTLKVHTLPEFKPYFAAGIKKLKTKNWKEILIDSELPIVNPSTAVNTVYYLNYLKTVDLTDEIHELFKKVWLTKEPKDEIDWQNKIYALTHIFIAASYFYQRFLEPKKFAWIYDYFEENIDDIIRYTNPDIVAEVGVCFKLGKINKSTALAKTKKYIFSKFDPKIGYIGREKNVSMEKCEHRNIVSLLLLTDFEELYDGPSLPQFMKKYGKSLFLPEKGKYIGTEELKD